MGAMVRAGMEMKSMTTPIRYPISDTGDTDAGRAAKSPMKAPDTKPNKMAKPMEADS